MTNRILSACLMAILLTIAGCKDKPDLTQVSPSYYDYSPVNIGHAVVYDVDSINYNFILPDNQHVDTAHYQIKELVADTFYDNLNRLSYRLERYRRASSTDSWQLEKVWHTYLSKTVYEKTEDDLRFVKMVYPVILDQHWDGNHYLPAIDSIRDIYHPFVGWDYHYTEVNAPKTINGLHFDSTATVSEVNNENLIDKNLSVEIYARHVGMIYREWDLLNKQDVSSTWANPNQVNGFRIKMSVNSYTP